MDSEYISSPRHSISVISSCSKNYHLMMISINETEHFSGPFLCLLVYWNEEPKWSSGSLSFCFSGIFLLPIIRIIPPQKPGPLVQQRLQLWKQEAEIPQVGTSTTLWFRDTCILSKATQHHMIAIGSKSLEILQGFRPKLML